MKKTVVYHMRLQEFTEYDEFGNIIKESAFKIPEKTEIILIQDHATIVFLDDGSKGVARCHPNDNTDETFGIKLAYLRAKKASIEKEIKQTLKDSHKYQ